MFGLVDCNNFYASCERVFNPALNNRPLLVLSNNDGCVIARSNEAKALGIRMGTPVFKIQDMIHQHDIAVFSSNYTLYGDMSARVMSMLSAAAPEIEIYSIDEAFLNLSGIRQPAEFGYKLTSDITTGTGIPVSMGIAPTKALAKIANKFAKKYPKYQRVCLIDTPEKRCRALALTPIEDVWGIGCRLAGKLRQQGICTAYDFSILNPHKVRKMMTVCGERLWRELNGQLCLSLENETPGKQQICTSRSFGTMLTNREELQEAVASFAARSAARLREQQSCAGAVMVFIQTNRFRTDLPQFIQNRVEHLPVATADSLKIVHAALTALKKLFHPGFHYKKAGVILLDIVPRNAVQMNLFSPRDSIKSERLMAAIDKINHGSNSRRIRLAVEGFDRSWHLRREMLSPCYSTDLKQIIEINCLNPDSPDHHKNF